MTSTPSSEAISVRNDSVDAPVLVVRAWDSSNEIPSRGWFAVKLVRTWKDPSASMNPASQALDVRADESSGNG